MSWEDQGRQEHGWFGNGTAPKKFAVAAGAREIFGRNELAQRIRAVAYGALGALPRALRARLAAQYDAGSLARLTEVMTATVPHLMSGWRPATLSCAKLPRK
jgi:hypothetical protein